MRRGVGSADHPGTKNMRKRQLFYFCVAGGFQGRYGGAKLKSGIFYLYSLGCEQTSGESKLTGHVIVHHGGSYMQFHFEFAVGSAKLEQYIHGIYMVGIQPSMPLLGRS